MCELARLFPDADVMAVDSSPAMLDGLPPADVIWASMSLHHIGDEVASLRLLGALLEPDGLIAAAELAEPMRLLPDDLDIGRPGLSGRPRRSVERGLPGCARGWPIRLRPPASSSSAHASPEEASIRHCRLTPVEWPSVTSNGAANSALNSLTTTIFTRSMY